MRLDLSEIVRNVGRQAVNEVDEQCDPDGFGFDCSEPIKGVLRFANTGEILLVTGEIHTRAKLECGRCLTESMLPMSVKIEEEFRIEHAGDMIEAVPMEEGDDPEGELISNNILNVRELVRLNLLLEVPIQPLCSEECKGLCPSCGENLNVTQCSCHEENHDSPFQALAELLEDEEDKS